MIYDPGAGEKKGAREDQKLKRPRIFRRGANKKKRKKLIKSSGNNGVAHKSENPISTESPFHPASFPGKFEPDGPAVASPAPAN